MVVTLANALKKREEISISVIGRSSGRTITLPVWFVLDGRTLWLLPVRGSRNQWFKNVLANRTITVKAGRVREILRARPVRDRAAVQRVVGQFKRKYSPSEIARYYTRFDAAVKMILLH